jgi:hypothetical protein
MNKVVLTDYACMETYKGNPLSNMAKSIKLVSKYPDQIVVLKGTREIIKLQLSGPCSAENLIDQKQSVGFRMFCTAISLATKGNSNLRNQINEKGNFALEHFDSLQRDAVGVVEAIIEIGQSFPSDVLALIRKQDPLPKDVADKIIYDILFLATSLFRNHSDVTSLPNAKLARNNLLFRFAVSSYLLALRWISSGGIESVRIERVRNDLIDMSYIAYATFFDGLLTNDKKMAALYKETTFLLENVLI